MTEFISTKLLRQSWGVSASYMRSVVNAMKDTGKYRIINDGRITLLKESDALDFLEAKNERENS